MMPPGPPGYSLAAAEAEAAAAAAAVAAAVAAVTAGGAGIPGVTESGAAKATASAPAAADKVPAELEVTCGAVHGMYYPHRSVHVFGFHADAYVAMFMPKLSWPTWPR